VRTKYLILDNLSSFGNTDGPVIFPEFETHKAVANRYGGKEHVIAAGFVQIYVEEGKLKVSCFGSSQGLKASSRGEDDARMIRRMFVDPMLEEPEEPDTEWLRKLTT